MALPQRSSLFHLRFVTGDKPPLKLDDEFLRNHTKVLLKSDASEKTWKVKLDGNRLAGGWEEFAAVHNFTDGDVLAFRHDGDEIFHVAVSSDTEHASPSFSDTDDSDSDDESDESDGAEGEDNDDDDNDAGDILLNKNKKAEADCFVKAPVTAHSLIKDRLDLSRDFKLMSFEKQNKPCEIYLANEKGRKWTLILSRNISNGVFYIRRGWANFCLVNGLSQGDICNFKLSEGGEKPLLLLCSQESDNGHEDKEEAEEECPEAADAVKTCSVEGCSKEKNTPSRFLTLEFTPNRLKSGQLYISMLSSGFFPERKSGEITLLDNQGRKWTSYLLMTGQSGSEYFYIRKGWREMCKANGVQVNDSFVMELICEDAISIFKFLYKIENKGKGNRTTSKKRACKTSLHGMTVEETPGVERVSKRGLNRVSNRPNTNLKRKQPEFYSVSDQVANVKQRIQDTLNTIRYFRAELKTREKNLEASLLEVDDLGERILGISKIRNNNQV